MLRAGETTQRVPLACCQAQLGHCCSAFWLAFWVRWIHVLQTCFPIEADALSTDS